MKKALVRASVVGLTISTLVAVAPGVAHADSFTPLKLRNGWTNAPLGTGDAAAEVVSGIVYLKGAISTTKHNPEPFKLPAKFRPPADVDVKVDLCSSNNGRLIIEPTGDVTVQAETDFANAQCMTSLDGVSYALTATTALTLQNGWTTAEGNSAPAVTNVSGVMHLMGGISGGTSAQAFTLPAAYRPPTEVFVPVDMCNATNGRLDIQSNGNVTVESETSLSVAQCFTSLDGVTFVRESPTTLTLKNGWKNAPFGTSNAARRTANGIVFLKGAIHDGQFELVFKLPAAVRPAHTVYLPVDLCDAANGRLEINSNGNVAVEPEGPFSDAQCFTSLDGVSYSP